MFLFYKFMEKKKSRDFEKNGSERRKNGNGADLNGALSKIAEAVSVNSQMKLPGPKPECPLSPIAVIQISEYRAK